MIVFCKQCCINWAVLHSQDDDGEESYEYCPVCRTDAHLTDGTDIEGYIMSPFTGRITSALTGKEFTKPEVKPKIRIQLK